MSPTASAGDLSVPSDEAYEPVDGRGWQKCAACHACLVHYSGGFGMNWLERRSRAGLGREAAERVSAGCYGAVVAASTLAGTAELPAGQLTLLVVATNLVYFGTHVFAYSIGDPDLERQHLHHVAARHARVGAPMISAAFLPLIVALVLEWLGINHERATNIGVFTAAGLLVVVALPGAYLHGVRGWGLALVTLLIVFMTALLVVAKVWLTH